MQIVIELLFIICASLISAANCNEIQTSNSTLIACYSCQNCQVVNQSTPKAFGKYCVKQQSTTGKIVRLAVQSSVCYENDVTYCCQQNLCNGSTGLRCHGNRSMLWHCLNVFLLIIANYFNNSLIA